MKKITQKILLFTSIFVLMLMGGVVLAENVEEADAEERIDALFEKIEELTELIVEMKEKGELPLAKEEVEVAEEVKCELYLTEYITYGANNTEKEVKKLQNFLNDHMGENIPVTGFYGEITMGVVNDFQVKYTDEILSPWGTTRPTGQVYKTTQRKINDIMCPDVTLAIPNVSVAVAERREATEIETEEGEEEETSFLEDTFFPLDGEEADEDEEDEDDENATAGMLTRGDGSTNYLPILIIIVGLIGIAAILHHLYSSKKQDKSRLIS